MMGKRALDAARVLVAATGLEGRLAPEDFLREREELLLGLFPSAALMPGVDSMVRHLHRHGVPMAVATSSHRRHYELKTERHRALFALMHHIVTGDDPEVKAGKPAPDIFLAAASRFEAPAPTPDQVLVFEDAPTGVQAAVNAKMPVVMVPDENLDCRLYEGADLVVKSLQDFDPNIWGLPAFGAT
eukprot:SM000116S24259  [mRNA]  locus=s116:310942:312383:- [translate_table: standard]